uniref:Uncharacterized protein n=1 Tax=Tanacetum cinerariifolium TaxID=118510 RepID=A0A699HTK9_TANCI|nr:hypothetical protein [Tanacetum cinerariifolium]
MQRKNKPAFPVTAANSPASPGCSQGLTIGEYMLTQLLAAYMKNKYIRNTANKQQTVKTSKREMTPEEVLPILKSVHVIGVMAAVIEVEIQNRIFDVKFKNPSTTNQAILFHIGKNTHVRYALWELMDLQLIKGQNMVLAEHQEEYQNLPVNVNPEDPMQPMTFCIQLFGDEVDQLLENGGKIYFTQSTFGNSFQPVSAQLTPPDTMSALNPEELVDALKLRVELESEIKRIKATVPLVLDVHNFTKGKKLLPTTADGYPLSNIAEGSMHMRKSPGLSKFNKVAIDLQIIAYVYNRINWAMDSVYPLTYENFLFMLRKDDAGNPIIFRTDMPSCQDTSLAIEAKNLQRIEYYVALGNQVYDDFLIEIANIASAYPGGIKAFSGFSFNKYSSIASKVNKLVKDTTLRVVNILNAGVDDAFLRANAKNDALVDAVFQGTGIPKKKLVRYYNRNLEAAVTRTTKSVYNITKQFTKITEGAIDSGIASGKTAVQLAADLRKAVKDPTPLFRKVKVTDADGKVSYKLSKAAVEYRKEHPAVPGKEPSNESERTVKSPPDQFLKYVEGDKLRSAVKRDKAPYWYTDNFNEKGKRIPGEVRGALYTYPVKAQEKKDTIAVVQPVLDGTQKDLADTVQAYASGVADPQLKSVLVDVVTAIKNVPTDKDPNSWYGYAVGVLGALFAAFAFIKGQEIECVKITSDGQAKIAKEEFARLRGAEITKIGAAYVNPGDFDLINAIDQDWTEKPMEALKKVGEAISKAKFPETDKTQFTDNPLTSKTERIRINQTVCSDVYGDLKGMEFKTLYPIGVLGMAVIIHPISKKAIAIAKDDYKVIIQEVDSKGEIPKMGTVTERMAIEDLEQLRSMVFDDSTSESLRAFDQIVSDIFSKSGDIERTFGYKKLIDSISIGNYRVFSPELADRIDGVMLQTITALNSPVRKEKLIHYWSTQKKIINKKVHDFSCMLVATSKEGEKNINDTKIKIIEPFVEDLITFSTDLLRQETSEKMLEYLESDSFGIPLSGGISMLVNMFGGESIKAEGAKCSEVKHPKGCFRGEWKPGTYYNGDTVTVGKIFYKLVTDYPLESIFNPTQSNVKNPVSGGPVWEKVIQPEIVKPPLGLMPQNIYTDQMNEALKVYENRFKSKRINMIIKAKGRYKSAGLAIPKEWDSELKMLQSLKKGGQ